MPGTASTRKAPKGVKGGANKKPGSTPTAPASAAPLTKRKRLAKESMEEELESESDAGPSDDEARDEESEDEDVLDKETAAEKRLRLAKAYIERLRENDEENEESDEDENNEGNRDSRVSEVLKKELRESRAYSQHRLAASVKRVEGCEGTVTKAHKGPVTGLALTRDARTAYTVSKDGAVVQWDMTTGTKEKFVAGPVDSRYSGPAYPGSFIPEGETSKRCVLACAVSFDGKFLATAGMDRRVHIWDTATRTQLVAFPGHKDIISSLRFRDGSYQLYSGSFDRTIKQWNLEDMMYLDTLYGHQAEIIGLDCDNRERPVTVSRDHTCRLWKIQDEKHLVFRGRGSLDCCCLVGNGNWVSGADDGALSLWGMMKKKPIMVVRDAHEAGGELGPSAAWVSSVAAVRGSDIVASGAADGYIRLWSVPEENNKLEEMYSVGARGFVNAMEFSRDGKILVAGMGQEPRLGRWARDSKAKNGLLVHRLTYR